jgi:hypothetical protein
LQGLANRVFAREAVNVVVMVAGLPVRVKAEPVPRQYRSCPHGHSAVMRKIITLPI